MSDRMVIVIDSEDEDASFSPASSPVKSVKTRGARAEGNDDDAGDRHQPGKTGPREPASDQRSTDPDFFQQVYEGKHGVPEDVVIPDSAKDTGAPHGSSSLKQKSGNPKAENSSSITDPTLKSATKSKRSAPGSKDLSHLTQVTTPGNDGSKSLPKDVYDFPSSDAEGAAARSTTGKANFRTVKSCGIGKRAQVTSIAAAPRSSPVHHPDSNDEDELARCSPRKREKASSQNGVEQSAEDVDLLVMPRTAMTTGEGNESLGGSLMADVFHELPNISEHRAAAFIMERPISLPTSQKQQYARISGSSDLEQIEKDDHLPSRPGPVARAQNPQSSEATIAYTTPSRYCSSVPGFPEIQGSGDLCSSILKPSGNRRTSSSSRVTRSQPKSSPDELKSFSLVQGSIETQSMRAVHDDESAPNDLGNSNGINCHRELYMSRSNRRRPGTDLEDDSEQTTQANLPVGGVQKKRQKTGEHHDTALEGSCYSNEIGRPHNYSSGPSGRTPRSIELIQEEAEDLKAPHQSMPDTCSLGQESSRGATSAEPILASSRHQDDSMGINGIDPEYLAALPKNLRLEVIADYTNNNSQTSRARGRGRPRRGSISQLPSTSERLQSGDGARKRKDLVKEEAPRTPQATKVCAIPAAKATKKKKKGRPKKREIIQLPPAVAADNDSSLVLEGEEIAHAEDETKAGDDSLSPERVEAVPAVSDGLSKPKGKKNEAEELPTISKKREIVTDDERETRITKRTREFADAVRPSSKRIRNKRKVDEAPALPTEEAKETIHEAQEESLTSCVTHLEVDNKSRTLVDQPASPGFSNAGERDTLLDASNTLLPQRREDRFKRLEDSLPEQTVEERDKMPEGRQETKAREVQKSGASTNGRQSRVPFRVGLSRRSNIAPLLKKIEKKHYP